MRGVTAPSGTLVFVVRPADAWGEAKAGGQPLIYRAASDGTGLTRLARNASEPAASPDGSRIAFVRRGIWIMDARGHDQRRILGPEGGAYGPTWSADGASLFFLRQDGMSADGRGIRRVVEAACLDELSASPNGRDVAYVAWPSESSPNECDGWPPAIIARGVNGRRHRVLSGGRWAESPAWSPDGTLLAFSSDDAVNGPPWGIYIVGPAAVRRLTNRTGSPTWSPDGSHIAFADGGLWVIQSNGKGLRRLKRLPNLHLSDPVWLLSTSSP